MKYGRKVRRGRSEQDNDENLRGMLRELQKINKQLLAENKYLKKQLAMANNILNQDSESVQSVTHAKSEKKCPKCGSTSFSEVSIWNPNGEIEFLVCQKCLHREKK
jgi:DNA-directed RNA polymerase subunit M/transcription elongation factor TFIIS